MEKFDISTAPFYSKITTGAIKLRDGLIVPFPYSSDVSSRLSALFSAIKRTYVTYIAKNSSGATVAIIDTTTEEFNEAVGLFCAPAPYKVIKDADEIVKILSKEPAKKEEKSESGEDSTDPLTILKKLGKMVEGIEEKCDEDEIVEDDEDDDDDYEEEPAPGPGTGGKPGSAIEPSCDLAKIIEKMIKDAVHPSDSTECTVVTELANKIVAAVKTRMGLDTSSSTYPGAVPSGHVFLD